MNLDNEGIVLHLAGKKAEYLSPSYPLQVTEVNHPTFIQLFNEIKKTS